MLTSELAGRWNLSLDTTVETEINIRIFPLLRINMFHSFLLHDILLMSLFKFRLNPDILSFALNISLLSNVDYNFNYGMQVVYIHI